MGTNADTIQIAARPVGFTLWTAVVSVLAAAALVMSAAALTVASRDRAVAEATGIRQAAIADAPRWDAAKLEAMDGRMLAETVRISGQLPRWDTAKLEAMEGRMLAETVGYELVP